MKQIHFKTDKLDIITYEKNCKRKKGIQEYLFQRIVNLIMFFAPKIGDGHHCKVTKEGCPSRAHIPDFRN